MFKILELEDKMLFKIFEFNKNTGGTPCSFTSFLDDNFSINGIMSQSVVDNRLVCNLQIRGSERFLFNYLIEDFSYKYSSGVCSLVENYSISSHFNILRYYASFKGSDFIILALFSSGIFLLLYFKDDIEVLDSLIVELGVDEVCEY